MATQRTLSIIKPDAVERNLVGKIIARFEEEGLRPIAIRRVQLSRAEAEGFELGKSVGHFRANSKALAEGEGDGIAKVLFNKDTEQILGVHIIGLHAADLIQECANAKAAGTTVRELAFTTHSLNAPSMTSDLSLIHI